MTAPFDPESFVQRQLDAYNARDLARFVAEYTEDVQVFRLPGLQPARIGREALAAHRRVGQVRCRAHRTDLPTLTVEGHGPFPYQVDGDFLGEIEHLEFRHVPDVLDLVFPG